MPAYDSVDTLLADVDAVAIALPPDVQARLALRAAEARVHLLLDKPIALDVTAADRLVAAVEERGLASVVFFTNRFRREIDEFLCRAAATGGWDGARVTMFTSILQPGGPYADSAWRREKGGLWDIGPHALSLVVPVLGPVRQVTALGGPHATTHLLLQHAEGAVSTLALTLDAPPAATAIESVFHGSAGFAPVPAPVGSSVPAFRAAVSQLVAGVRGGTEHPCDVRFGRDVVAVLAAAETALWHRHVVQL